MAKFVYRMENVLKLKEQIESQRQMEFVQAQNKVLEEEEKMKALINRYRGYVNDQKEASKNKISIVNLRYFGDCIRVTKELIKAETVQVKVAKKNLEVAQKRLADAVMERKIQDKLKERAFEEFKRELSKEEMKEIDEVISFNYNNRSIWTQWMKF